MEKAEYYKASTDSVMPVRWLSPEQLQYGKSSHQSDVYSFGVLMWELFSGGAMPFGGLSNAEVSERILKGVHLEKIENCPVNELMEKCWEMEPRNRPSFEEILQTLNRVRE